MIEGKLQDPDEALTEEENRRAKALEEEKAQKEMEKELAQKAYGESVRQIKELLLMDKQKVRAKKLTEEKQEEMLLVIDMLGNAITSEDRDAIIYAFVSYKFMVKANWLTFYGREKKIFNLLKGVLDAI